MLADHDFRQLVNFQTDHTSDRHHQHRRVPDGFAAGNQNAAFENHIADQTDHAGFTQHFKHHIVGMHVKRFNPIHRAILRNDKIFISHAIDRMIQKKPQGFALGFKSGKKLFAGQGFSQPHGIRIVGKVQKQEASGHQGNAVYQK